ncbi:MAG TPA: hypothetical protein VH502_03555 [Actinoplanes sp.]
MKITRRIGAFLAATVAAPGLASVVAPAPASAARPHGPHPVNQWLQPVPAGTPTWVKVWWRTDRRVCDARLVVWGGSTVAVTYPSDRSYTSFSNGSTLSRRETDYTSFRVTAAGPTLPLLGSALLRARLLYNDCGRFARTRWTDTGFLLPVTRPATR